MAATVILQFRSNLAASAQTVWAEASTMTGVNAELGPWLRMSYPARAERLGDADVAAGTVFFWSWLLLFGLLPIDRHALRLERLYPGAGFDERSHSLSQKSWVHRRRVVRISDSSCMLTDELEFTPRIALMAAFLKPVVTALFRHRHRRLMARYGEAT